MRDFTSNVDDDDLIASRDNRNSTINRPDIDPGMEDDDDDWGNIGGSDDTEGWSSNFGRDSMSGSPFSDMDSGMDTGDMILKQETAIGENETTGELWQRLSKIGGNLLVETLNLLEKGIAPREKQSEEYTLAPMLHKEMAKIDWENQSSYSKNYTKNNR